MQRDKHQVKIAVLSDIHGNIDALDAVLADLAARNVDLCVNLGDILSGPLFPCETADRLMAMDLPTIRGNHERQLLTLAPDRMGASDRATHDLLAPRHRDWIAGLPETLWLTDEMLMVHGTPGSDIDYWLETVEPTGLRAATEVEVEARAGDVVAPLILCGHTHVPRIHRRADGGLVVNPGSVGLPGYEDDRPWPHKVETGSPEARYALVEQTADGWHAEIMLVAYDAERAAATADARGRPDWARALRTGRM
ncbi:metallophosphoesterase [Sphingobium yanoikuyae]|uniref:Metallophosphoesterase n=1 Tax=Sphingobium yanoikuyae TaxID=13690 RepID=A0A3G2URL2_SPHYA|nr:metallophosphoesterase [Sphingobium yanoikuyae]